MTLHVSHLRYCQTRAAAALRLPLRGHGSVELARLVASPPHLASVVARIARLRKRCGVCRDLGGALAAPVINVDETRWARLGSSSPSAARLGCARADRLLLSHPGG